MVEVTPPTAAILESIVRSLLPSVIGPVMLRAVDLSVVGVVRVKVPAVIDAEKDNALTAVVKWKTTCVKVVNTKIHQCLTYNE